MYENWIKIQENVSWFVRVYFSKVSIVKDFEDDYKKPCRSMQQKNSRLQPEVFEVSHQDAEMNFMKTCKIPIRISTFFG